MSNETLRLNARQLSDLLRRQNACVKARDFASGKTLSEAWVACDRADWMLWLCGRMAGETGWPTRQELVLAACACAETVLPLFEKKYPNDDRPRKAIEAARGWARGTEVVATVRSAAAAYAAYAAAAYAADSADYADYAAYAAAAAAAAYSAAAYADSAAYAAAYAAAAYADSAAYSADYADSARAGKLKLADLVRSLLQVPACSDAAAALARRDAETRLEAVALLRKAAEYLPHWHESTHGNGCDRCEVEADVHALLTRQLDEAKAPKDATKENHNET